MKKVLFIMVVVFVVRVGLFSGRNLLAGHRNEIMSSMHTELQEGVQALQEILRGARLDLLEICAPWDSPLTKAVEEAGGRAVALGLQNGYDLTTTSGFRKAAQFIREMKPRYVHISPSLFSLVTHAKSESQ